MERINKRLPQSWLAIQQSFKYLKAMGNPTTAIFSIYVKLEKVCLQNREMGFIMYLVIKTDRKGGIYDEGGEIMGELFTIGHSQYSVKYFVEVLNKYGIDYLLDVRSIPYSKYAEQYNKESISKELNHVNIKYVFMGNYFGARPQNMELYNDEGYLDFERVRKSQDFCKGIENVIMGLNQGHRIALMCTEKEPIDCHRAILVARAFELRMVYAKHILSNGKILTQKQLDEQLLEKYFPDRRQLSLFTYEKQISEEEYLAEAYKIRNGEIGYYIDNTKKVFAI